MMVWKFYQNREGLSLMRVAMIQHQHEVGLGVAAASLTKWHGEAMLAGVPDSTAVVRREKKVIDAELASSTEMALAFLKDRIFITKLLNQYTLQYYYYEVLPCRHCVREVARLG